SASRVSETMSKTLFYYAVRLDNGTVMRVSRVADSFWAVLQNVFPSVLGVCVILFAFCIVLSNYFTKSIIKPIDKMAENLSEPGVEVPYKELSPFMTTIRQQHADILDSARMRQEFTANVSHELKTPLTAISGYAELIEHGMADKENAARFAGEIHKNAARLLSLINDIIQLSQLDGGRKQMEFVNLDLYALAQECVDMLALNAQKQNVTMQVSGKPSMIMADKQLMEELVYNLCDNAIRYNNRGGSVNVTVGQESGHTFLVVKDTGIGISKENQERVFERFYRVDKSRSKATGGTGLGLAIVKHIVSQHGAKISIESEEGKGTEIRVDFSDLAPMNN
ncbi:MAG: ATP-binding protein, partial [Lachnospiraceae bacterium]|nr:ATP-binding protein [Lachnospiraceae bacterium]